MSKPRGLNLPLLLRITQRLLTELFPKHSHELGVHYVGRKKITALNEKYVGHKGSTDVITFDYTGTRGSVLACGGPLPLSNAPLLHAEIFICLDEAIAQAKEFDTTPQMELIRYLVHGLLHLRGYDDLQPAKRARMKRAEDKWVRWVAANFPCEKVWSRKRAD